MTHNQGVVRSCPTGTTKKIRALQVNLWGSDFLFARNLPATCPMLLFFCATNIRNFSKTTNKTNYLFFACLKEFKFISIRNLFKKVSFFRVFFQKISLFFTLICWIFYGYNIFLKKPRPRTGLIVIIKFRCRLDTPTYT